MWTFTENEHVSSFRSAVPSDTFLKLLGNILKRDASAPTSVATSASNLGKRMSRVYPIHDRLSSIIAPKDVVMGDKERPKGHDDTKVTKQEARRLKKERRRAEVKNILYG